MLYALLVHYCYFIGSFLTTRIQTFRQKTCQNSKLLEISISRFSKFVFKLFYGYSPKPSLASFWKIGLGIISFIINNFSARRLEDPKFQKLVILASFHSLVKSGLGVLTSPDVF